MMDRTLEESNTQSVSDIVVRDSEFIANEIPNPSGVVVRTQQFDERRWREATRSSLAIGLAVLLGAVILTVVVAVILGFDVVVAKEILTSVLPPLFTLVGAATGFYYGGKDK